jgi:hypothetical protein
MRFLLATSILASILISGRIAAEAGPMETAPPPAAAPTIVNVQPRARDFNSHYAVNRAEQKRLSRFDARQRKLDKAPDDNCRCRSSPLSRRTTEADRCPIATHQTHPLQNGVCE